MPTGTVKFFNAAKGFGFITADEGGKDIFAPAISLAATGLSGLKTGQRVAFETKPDVKGPKAVSITLLADVPPPAAKTLPPAPMGEATGQMIFYHDPASSESCTALEKLRASGFEPRVVEYLATPPPIAELKNLSLLLRNSDQSLVRKYDPLFRELCLDDRFISETEFWGAIVEHPSLINGPVVATQTKAGICRSKKDVETFLAAIAPGWIQPAPKQKSLPEGILRLLGGTIPPRPEKEQPPKPAEPGVKAAEKSELVNKAPVKSPPQKLVKPAPKPKPAPAPKKKLPAKPKPKPAAKPKKSAAKKPAKKIGRARK